MTGDVDFRWELESDEQRKLQLGPSRLMFVHPKLGHVNVPVHTSSTAGRGLVLSSSIGSASSLDKVVVHWLNVPKAYPADALETPDGTWADRWTASGGGWSCVFDARRDHAGVVSEAKGRPFHVVTHVGLLRRSAGQAFSPDEAVDGLYSWQVALSVALGRWVAPALAVGFADGKRVWELWSPWRCDVMRGSQAWSDFHRSDELRAFLALFLSAWNDPNRRDRVRHFAHHLIESNEHAMTLEARIMLAGAALEYLAWVKFVLDETRRSPDEQRKRSAAENLRELLEDAGIPVDVPADLTAIERIRVEKRRQDGPEAVTWVRNRLVHPKDASEPYQLEHLVLETWQLLMQYGELLLLHEVGYSGSYCPRFPSGRGVHDTVPVPWFRAAD